MELPISPQPNREEPVDSPGNSSTMSAEDAAMIRLAEQSEEVYRNGSEMAKELSETGTQKLLDCHKTVLREYFAKGLEADVKAVEDQQIVKNCKIHEHVTP